MRSPVLFFLFTSTLSELEAVPGGFPKWGARTTHGPLSGFQDNPSSNFLSGLLFMIPAEFTVGA